MRDFFDWGVVSRLKESMSESNLSRAKEEASRLNVSSSNAK
jgi:hypothetical protein